mmetsp:Transcript_56370/g.104286  ORF Transcript_56370/g.104286 Transcript_56370/m.104286 type:complete len:437 (-) Transcript_56370:88-1398(-)
MTPPCTKYYNLSPGGSPPRGGGNANELLQEFVQAEASPRAMRSEGSGGQALSPQTTLRFLLPVVVREAPAPAGVPRWPLGRLREQHSPTRECSPTSLEASYAGLSQVGRFAVGFGMEESNKPDHGITHEGSTFRSTCEGAQLALEVRMEGIARDFKGTKQVVEPPKMSVLEKRCESLESECERWQATARDLEKRLQAAEAELRGTTNSLRPASRLTSPRRDSPRASRQTAVQTSPEHLGLSQVLELPRPLGTPVRSSLSSAMSTPLPPHLGQRHCRASYSESRMQEAADTCHAAWPPTQFGPVPAFPRREEITETWSQFPVSMVPALPREESMSSYSAASSVVVPPGTSGQFAASVSAVTPLDTLTKDLQLPTFAVKTRLGASTIHEDMQATQDTQRPTGAGTTTDDDASRYSMLRICENLPRNLYSMPASRRESS